MRRATGRGSGQAGEWKGELVLDKGELSGKATMVMTEMARRARIMARRRRHIPPITDDNFHEEWNKFKMGLDASEDDIAKAESCGNGNLSRASRTAAAIEVPSRPRCACRCGCRRRPGRRIQCPGCGHLVGPGCDPVPCWNQQTGACHVCAQGNPQENIGEAARAPHPGAAGRWVGLRRA